MDEGVGVDGLDQNLDSPSGKLCCNDGVWYDVQRVAGDGWWV